MILYLVALALVICLFLLLRQKNRESFILIKPY